MIKNPGVRYFRQKRGWYWNYKSIGGRIIARSGGPYCNKTAAKRAFMSFVQKLISILISREADRASGSVTGKGG